MSKFCYELKIGIWNLEKLFCEEFEDQDYFLLGVSLERESCPEFFRGQVWPFRGDSTGD